MLESIKCPSCGYLAIQHPDGQGVCTHCGYLWQYSLGTDIGMSALRCPVIICSRDDCTNCPMDIKIKLSNRISTTIEKYLDDYNAIYNCNKIKEEILEVLVD